MPLQKVVLPDPAGPTTSWPNDMLRAFSCLSDARGWLLPHHRSGHGHWRMERACDTLRFVHVIASKRCSPCLPEAALSGDDGETEVVQLDDHAGRVADRVGGVHSHPVRL